MVFDKSMEESGEGAVIYLATTEIIEGEEKEIIRGLIKLKTFEYRFLRKIREKCKLIPQRENIMENEILNIIEKLVSFTIKETQNLLKESQNSKYYKNTSIFFEWILFAKKVFLYWYLDGYNYVDNFATFIDKMKKIFYKSDDFNITEDLIKEVRNDVLRNK